MSIAQFTTIGKQKAAAKIRLDGAYKITAWYNGYPTELSAENGACEIRLDSGEGVFVTLAPQE